MNKFISENTDFRKRVFEETAAGMHTLASHIEKDFWVCWTLKLLFSSDPLRDHMIFKGGTSLSKAYGLINRFSEDIDITLDRSLFGFDKEKNPDSATSNKKRKEYVKQMVAASREYIQGDFFSILKEAVKKNLWDNEELSWEITVDPTASDGQALLFKYPRTGVDYGYVTPAVKIELGSRADFWPVEKHTLTSYASVKYPDCVDDFQVMITTLLPVRTFWEKATILHEETFRPEGNLIPRGYSRHYYDVYMMNAAGITEHALADTELRGRVVEHKTLFYKRSWSRYDLAVPGSFKLILPKKTVSELKKDYVLMEPMIFGDIPTFDDIMDELASLEERINAS